MSSAKVQNEKRTFHYRVAREVKSRNRPCCDLGHSEWQTGRSRALSADMQRYAKLAEQSIIRSQFSQLRKRIDHRSAAANVSSSNVVVTATHTGSFRGAQSIHRVLDDPAIPGAHTQVPASRSERLPGRAWDAATGCYPPPTRNDRRCRALQKPSSRFRGVAEVASAIR